MTVTARLTGEQLRKRARPRRTQDCDATGYGQQVRTQAGEQTQVRRRGPHADAVGTQTQAGTQTQTRTQTQAGKPDTAGETGGTDSGTGKRDGPARAPAPASATAPAAAPATAAAPGNGGGSPLERPPL